MATQENPTVKVFATATEDEVARAAAQSMRVREILNEARNRGAEDPVSTPESLRESAEFMDQMRRGSAEWLMRQIETKQLIPEGELRAILGVNQESVTDALNSNRMYFISMPSGERYFPKFLCDAKYDLRTLELVCQKLGSIPGSSKHFFFTSISTYLQGKSPLAALATGNIAQVLTAAEGFSER